MFSMPNQRVLYREFCRETFLDSEVGNVLVALPLDELV